MNVRDGNGATPLHLASRHKRPECVHILLDNGALVCASTGGYGSVHPLSLSVRIHGCRYQPYSLNFDCRCPGSTPLHLAARGGSLDCVRALLAWGADRLQRDSSGLIFLITIYKIQSFKLICCLSSDMYEFYTARSFCCIDLYIFGL